MSWDAAMIAELRRVYSDAAAVPLMTGGGFGLAHDEGLIAVAAFAVAIERDGKFEPPSF